MESLKALPLLESFHRSANVECSLAYMGSILSFLASSSETGGALSVLLAHSRAGSEPPPHIHHREHELFYMLDGEIEFFCEGDESSFVVSSGDMAFLPQGKAHGMYFRSTEIRALIILHAQEGGSIGIEPYFKQMAIGPAGSMRLPELVTQYSTAEPDEMQKAFRLAAANGITLLSPEETVRRLPFYPGFGANI